MTTATLGVPAAVAAGATTTAAVTIPSAHVCQVPGGITYASARSFVEPTADNKRVLADLLTRLAIPSPLGELLISGHTDLVGSASSNLTLSGRRAAGVQALLADDASGWESLLAAEGWGDAELGVMVVEVGDAPAGDPAAIAAAVAAVRGPSHTAARATLFHRYFTALRAGAGVPVIIPATPPTLGCGLTQPLRGSAAAPSRDPALPPITGAFRPNRRVELYFTDGSAALTCADYPTWTTSCSLTAPVPTVSVTIAPLDTVPLRGTADLQVTVSPSPLPFGTSVTLSVTTVAGGDAVFTASGGAGTTVTGTGPVRLRGEAPSTVTDDVQVTATLTGASTALAAEAFTVVDRFSAFLRFEVFNVGTKAFDPLPPAVAVDLMDADPLSNDVVATADTTAGGRVLFNLPDLSASGEATPDLFFLARTDGLSSAGHTLPAEWSTSGWDAADGSPGLLSNFSGPMIGTPDAPRVFRVGLDVHAQFEYTDGRPSPATPTKRAPQGVPVGIHSRLGMPRETTVRTDADGQVHAVLFEALPGEDLWFDVAFEIEDATAGLPRAEVVLVPGASATWETTFPDADQVIQRSVRASVGTVAAPLPITATLDNRDVAFFLLTVVREWNTFLVEITDRRWTGIQDLKVALLPIPSPARPFSFPVGRVNLLPDPIPCGTTGGPTVRVPSHWCRELVVHELSHQIMWRESAVTSTEIATSFLRGLATTPPDDFVYLQMHYPELVTGRLTALVEGWAAFVEGIFAGPVTPPPYPFPVSGGAPQVDLPTATGTVRAPLMTPANRGEQVEGAYANAVFAVFEKHVLVTPGPLGGHVPESPNGDILTGPVAGWMTPAVKARFHSMIWQPLQDVRSAPDLANKHTTLFFTGMRARNPATWHELLPELQAFNMMMTAPTITAVTPSGGPPAGGTTITVTGTDFTSGATVLVGGSPATSVSLGSSSSLAAVTPAGSPGPADVVVRTAAGAATSAGSFTYAPPPTIAAVTDVFGAPARGTTEGGTFVQIDGSGFDPAAAVFFGSTPVPAPAVLTSTRISATSPAHCPAEAVDVSVINPDGQSATLTPGFEYVFVHPAPRIAGVDPPGGSPTGGDAVTVFGTGFRPGVRLLVGGGDAAVDAGATTATEIHAVTPPGGSGPADLTVLNPDCQEDTVVNGWEYL